MKIKNLFKSPFKAGVVIISVIVIVGLLGAASVFATTEIAKANSIGNDNAISFAYVDAGIDPVSAEYSRAKFEFKQGQFVYKVEFTSNGTEYEYLIKADDGTVVKKEQKMLSLTDSDTASPSEKTDIEAAKRIAVADSGAKESEVVFIKAESEQKDGKAVYEIKFKTASHIFEYKILAESGSILEKESEKLPNNSSSSKQEEPSESTNTPDTPNTPETPDTGTPEDTTDESDKNAAHRLSLEDAKKLALSDAKINASDASFTEAKKDIHNKLEVYELEFITETGRYEYTIDAASGKILEKEVKEIKTSSGDKIPSNGDGTSNTTIDLEAAKNIAIKDSGIASKDIRHIDAEADTDDGITVFEIKFYTASHKYEYEINAKAGKIISSSCEAIGTQENGSTGSSYIGIEKAKIIAVNHVKLDVSDVVFSKAKLEKKHKHAEYEIEFFKGNTEYEFKIDAFSGAILEWEIEEDD